MALIIASGPIAGLGMEVAVMGDDSKLLNLAQTGIMDERWIPFSFDENYAKILSLEKNALAEFHSLSLLNTGYLSETLPEEVVHFALSLDVGPVLFDPDEDPNNKNEYFVNEVTQCQFHSESDIADISCIICLLGDGEFVVGRGEQEIDPAVGYVGSSVLEIPITDPVSPDPSKEITNVMSVAIDMCVPPQEILYGCTPGYWKQPQHFDSWVSYTPDQSFEEVFGDDSFDTLLDALKAGGGGIKALGRHTVAALLNSASQDVDYPFSQQEIIDHYNDAINDDNFEDVKNMFEFQNEQECPLN